MTNTRHARKRQRRNKRLAKAEAKAEALIASARITEDVELGRFRRLRMCTRKRGYDTELKAIRAAIRSSEDYGLPFRYYRCPHCGLWHLTSDVDGPDCENGAECAANHRPTKRAAGRSGEGRMLQLDNRIEVLGFAVDYLDMYLNESTDEELLVEGFRELCEGLGFKLACSDWFTRSYPESALYHAGDFLDVVGEIEDPMLLGSAILFHWRWATHWAKEPLMDEGNREWFIAAFRRLVELSR